MLDRTAPEPLRSTMLDVPGSGVRHGFFTRAGGVSEGIYRGLNAGHGSRDARASVDENRRRIAAWLGVAPPDIVTVWQVHSPDVIVVSAPIEGERPKADAMVTDRPGLALGVMTADCGPVLFADHEAGIVGAAHAGWRGALTGVLENTVAAMERLGARRERIRAALGPAIGPRSYEVGPEFVARFVEAEPANERYFAPSGREAHALFDLNAYTLDRLVAAGVAADHVARCTYEEEPLFFSYRRATHRGEDDYGRQISAIVMEKR